MSRIQCFLIEYSTNKADVKWEDRPNTGRVGTYPWRKQGETELHYEKVPPGAMWWMNDLGEPFQPSKYYQPDSQGRILCVMTPGGIWVVDSSCSNCGLSDVVEHHCWCRHGEPPIVTVDKNPQGTRFGKTCSAGGGSIDMGGRYHGFLRNGYLEEC